MAPVFFFIAAVGAIAGAIGVVTLRHPLYSVLSLVFHLLSLAALFLLLNAAFVAAAQVVVYAGAVMVLYVFVVAYVGGVPEPSGLPGGRPVQALSLGVVALLLIELLIATLGSGLKAVGTEGPVSPAGFGSPQQIGELFLTDFLLAFEVASFLLLIAAVGAVVLARRRGGVEDPEAEGRISVAQLLAPDGLGSMAESVSGRSGMKDGDR
jgi:NADH:ubiquinone oxidoreductase subunit 6 (subunit J)